jgi:hypothetical protein
VFHTEATVSETGKGSKNMKRGGNMFKGREYIMGLSVNSATQLE